MIGISTLFSKERVPDITCPVPGLALGQSHLCQLVFQDIV